MNIRINYLLILPLGLLAGPIVSGAEATNSAPPVEWKGNKIVSRVLPYPDFTSLFIRLPIAHAAATGQGVKVAVIQSAADDAWLNLVRQVATRAQVTALVLSPADLSSDQWQPKLTATDCRIALFPDLAQWPGARLLALAEYLAAQKILTVIPSDLSEDPGAVELINQLHSRGCLTVGRLDRQSLVTTGGQREGEGSQPFNRHIRTLETDVFSTVGLSPDVADFPAATAAGVAALVLEKWPNLNPAEVRQKLVAGARAVWQATSLRTGKWAMAFTVDPITTRYTPTDEQAIFRFRVLDAAGALEVDTDIPWFLNMLNCQRAWEISKGKGMVAVMTDQGFHIGHPELAPRLAAKQHFGPVTFGSPHQNFHGTDMSRILLAVAPEARIIPVLCSGTAMAAEGDLADNIAQSFRYAVEAKADVISSSWAGWFNTNEKLLAAVRGAADQGVVVSWFHYPKPYPGVLRSGFTYLGWDASQLGFADRFLTDPPGFHPVEIEAGLSGTAPQAAGLALLVKSVNPKLTPKQIEDLIVANATPIGKGVLIPDAYKTLLAARPGKAAAPAQSRLEWPAPQRFSLCQCRVKLLGLRSKASH